MASTYWQAGWKLTAARLNAWTDRVVPSISTAALGSNQSVTGSEADVSGCTVTVTTTTAGARWRVMGMIQAEITGSSIYNPYVQIVCHADGAAAGGAAVVTVGASSRIPCAYEWVGTFATAGTHTLKLRCSLGGSGSAILLSGVTNINVEIREAA